MKIAGNSQALDHSFSTLAADLAAVQPFTQCPHHLPVPQAINEGVEHRSKNCVED